jgi:hypothetical protein
MWTGLCTLPDKGNCLLSFFSTPMQDSNFHLVDSRPTRSKNMGQRRHNFQQKRNVDKDDYRTVNPKSENQRNRQQQQPKRPQHWREQRVR